MNLGLRWEYNSVPKELNNLTGNFNPSAPTGVQQIGYGLTSTYNGDYKNFAPRLGIAWDVFGNGRTVVRAGGGIYYSSTALDVFNGIGNANGLRATPTGAGLVYCSVPSNVGCGSAERRDRGRSGAYRHDRRDQHGLRGHSHSGWDGLCY